MIRPQRVELRMYGDTVRVRKVSPASQAGAGMASLRHSGVDFALAASSILLGMPTSTQTEWLTVSEAARLLGKCGRVNRRYIVRDGLPRSRVRGRGDEPGP